MDKLPKGWNLRIIEDEEESWIAVDAPNGGGAAFSAERGSVRAQILQDLSIASIAGSDTHVSVPVDQIKKYQLAICKVRKAAVHGLYAEAPETTMFEEALNELYSLISWDECEVIMNEKINTRLMSTTDDGRIFVPVEPTEEMIKAGYLAIKHLFYGNERGYANDQIIDCYKAMIEASKGE